MNQVGQEKKMQKEIELSHYLDVAKAKSVLAESKGLRFQITNIGFSKTVTQRLLQNEIVVDKKRPGGPAGGDSAPKRIKMEPSNN